MLTQICGFLFFISLICIAFLFVGFAFFSSTKDYAIIKKWKTRKAKKKSNKSNSKKQPTKHHNNPIFQMLRSIIFLMALLIVYVGFNSYYFARLQSNFDILEDNAIKYAAISHDGNYIYVIKCECSCNKIILYPNIHKFICSETVALETQYFNSVDKK
jgi:Ni,Fe-hydrogenase I cytochrome b subunit